MKPKASVTALDEGAPMWSLDAGQRVGHQARPTVSLVSSLLVSSLGVVSLVPAVITFRRVGTASIIGATLQ